MTDPDRSEGDINLSDRCTAWQAQHLDEATRQLLADDARWFLHQSMSTPCLNALQGAQGAWLTDTAGRRILDFPGNSLHQVGQAQVLVLAPPLNVDEADLFRALDCVASAINAQVQARSRA